MSFSSKPVMALSYLISPGRCAILDDGCLFAWGVPGYVSDQLHNMHSADSWCLH